MDKYLIDANVLIAAYRRNYPMDVIPTFWENLLKEAKSERFYIIDEIFSEIKAGEDLLTEWLESNIESFIIRTSDDDLVIKSYTEIIQYVMDNDTYTLKAKTEFASIADSWLIAHAKAYNFVIVTEEVFDVNCKKRILIPNICRHFRVKYINTMQFLRDIKVKI
jgi:predicted nucleic acid-binding protein